MIQNRASPESSGRRVIRTIPPRCACPGRAAQLQKSSQFTNLHSLCAIVSEVADGCQTPNSTLHIDIPRLKAVCCQGHSLDSSFGAAHEHQTNAPRMLMEPRLAVQDPIGACEDLSGARASDGRPGRVGSAWPEVGKDSCGQALPGRTAVNMVQPSRAAAPSGSGAALVQG